MDSCFQALQVLTEGIQLIPQSLDQLLVHSHLFSVRNFLSLKFLLMGVFFLLQQVTQLQSLAPLFLELVGELLYLLQ